MDDKERRLLLIVAGRLQNYADYHMSLWRRTAATMPGFSAMPPNQNLCRIAGMARAFNITPMHWRKYRKGKLDARVSDCQPVTVG